MRRLVSALATLITVGLMLFSAWDTIARMTMDRDFFLAVAVVLGAAALFGLVLGLKPVRGLALRYPGWLYSLGGMMLLGSAAWMGGLIVLPARLPPTDFNLYGSSLLLLLGLLTVAVPFVLRPQPETRNRTDVSP